MRDLARGLIYSGLFVIPFVVLIISNSMFFPFITGKNFTFRILVEIVFAAWVILAFYEPQYRPKFSWILASFLALLGIMFVSNIQGMNPQQSFWSNFERMEGYVTLVHTFLYMLVAGSVLTTQKLWNKYFHTILGVSLLLSFYAFAQLSGDIVINQGGGRLDGTLGNSAYMAIYTLFLIFITFLMLFRAKSTGMKYTYGALALLFVYLLIQTATRGTVLGFVIGSFLMVVYIALFSKDHPKMRKIAVGGIVGIIALVGLFITFKESSFIQGNPYLQRISTISIKEGGNRFNIWSMAFEGVKERPLLGWGQGNYNYVFNKYYRPELHAGEAWFDRVHNIALDWLVAGGFVGAIAYFAIFFSALYYLFLRPLLNKADNSFTVVERGVLIGLLAGYLIHNVFVFDNIVSYIFYGVILAYIHSRVSVPIPRLEKWKIDPQIVGQIVAPVVAVGMLVVIYFVNIPSIQASKDIIVAFRATDPAVMLESFETALARDSFGNQEIREQMTQRVQSILQNADISAEMKQTAFKRVEEELLKQVKEKPGDARVHIFIASFYRMTNNIDSAIAQLEIARSLSPRKQLIMFEQGLSYLQKGENEKGMGFFKEAYDLSPQFDDVRVYYAMSAIYNGKLGLVDELIQTPEQKYAFAVNQHAIQAVYQAKMYPRLIEMFNLQIEKAPQDTQARTNLAYIFNETGNGAKAIEILTQAGKDIPTFKEQADGFIASISAESKAVVEVNGQTVPVNVPGR